MNSNSVTYKQIEDSLSDGTFNNFSEKIKEKIERIVNAWYGQQDFDTVEKLTNINIWNTVEDDEDDDVIEDAGSREAALDEAKTEWNKRSTELKMCEFANNSDSDEFIKLWKEI